MRTKEEIYKELKEVLDIVGGNEDIINKYLFKSMLEIFIDIRDLLLQEKTDSSPPCQHEWKTYRRVGTPWSQQCIKCSLSR